MMKKELKKNRTFMFYPATDLKLEAIVNLKKEESDDEGKRYSKNSVVEEAIDYYLVGLKHWNQALVYAAGKIVQYSSDNLISLWNESLELATAKGEKLDE